MYTDSSIVQRHRRTPLFLTLISLDINRLIRTFTILNPFKIGFRDRKNKTPSRRRLLPSSNIHRFKRGNHSILPLKGNKMEWKLKPVSELWEKTGKSTSSLWGTWTNTSVSYGDGEWYTRHSSDYWSSRVSAFIKTWWVTFSCIEYSSRFGRFVWL